MVICTSAIQYSKQGKKSETTTINWDIRLIQRVGAGMMGTFGRWSWVSDSLTLAITVHRKERSILSNLKNISHDFISGTNLEVYDILTVEVSI